MGQTKTSRLRGPHYPIRHEAHGGGTPEKGSCQALPVSRMQIGLHLPSKERNQEP